MATPAIAVNETPPIIEAYAQTTINGTGLSGGNSSATDSITVNGTTVTVPVAHFYSDVTLGFAPLVVQFTDSSQNLPDSWSWDFGDGGSSTLQNPAYTYNAGGQFSAVLMATNAAGSSNFTSNISVYAPGFSVFPTSGITGTDIHVHGYRDRVSATHCVVMELRGYWCRQQQFIPECDPQVTILPGIYNVTLRITSPARHGMGEQECCSDGFVTVNLNHLPQPACTYTSGSGFSIAEGFIMGGACWKLPGWWDRYIPEICLIPQPSGNVSPWPEQNGRQDPFHWMEWTATSWFLFSAARLILYAY